MHLSSTVQPQLLNKAAVQEAAVQQAAATPPPGQCVAVACVFFFCGPPFGWRASARVARCWSSKLA
jgi:hypothetical protein